MFLRSGAAWHLDAAGVHTFMAYLDERGIDPADVDPIPVGLFLEYAAWFQEKASVKVVPDLVCNSLSPMGALRRRWRAVGA